MASWIVLDWDHDQFHILSAHTTRRGVEITHALTWAHPETLTAGTADRVAKALRDFLKEQKIAPAPVIVGIGRDRIFLKELHIPPIAAHEEASLVRFQTGKEMAEGIDNYAVDYAYLANGGAERHIMTVAARRDIVALCQTLCLSAGLKLHAITPKLFGSALVLTRSLQPEASPLKAKQLNVVLTIGKRWAELCFFRGDRLLQVQALANGTLLAGEVKRNLAVFQAQHAVDVDMDGPSCLYVFGDDAAALESLAKSQPLPVCLLDPLKHDSSVAAEVKRPGDFAGAIGLAALWGQDSPRPVNLSAPKRQQAPTSANQKRLVIYGAIAVLAAIVLIGSIAWVFVGKRALVAKLTTDKKDLETELTTFAQERADLDAYKDWEQSTVPWLDEMYDLTARYPYKPGFRVNQLAASTTGSKKSSKDGFVGNIRLSGITPTGKDNYVYDLQASMARDAHVRPGIDNIKKGTDFSMKIDVAKQDVKKYDTVLRVPPRPKAEPEMKMSAEEKMEAEDTMSPEDDGPSPPATLPKSEKKKQSDEPDPDEKGDGK